jgi:hypothetical protein
MYKTDQEVNKGEIEKVYDPVLKCYLWVNKGDERYEVRENK